MTADLLTSGSLPPWPAAGGGAGRADGLMPAPADWAGHVGCDRTGAGARGAACGAGPNGGCPPQDAAGLAGPGPNGPAPAGAGPGGEPSVAVAGTGSLTVPGHTAVGGCGGCAARGADSSRVCALRPPASASRSAAANSPQPA